MAVTIVQTVQRNVSAAGVATVAITYGTNPTAGNLLIAVWHAGNSSAPVTGSVTSTNNGTWTVATGSTIQDNNFKSECGVSYVKNCAGGADTVTLTASGAGASGKQTLIIFEVSGCSTTAPNIAANANKGTSSVPDAGNVTTTAANSIIVAGVRTIANNCTQGSGYTQDFNAAGFQFEVTEHRIETATGTFAGNFTTSTSFWNATVAAFQEDAGGGGRTTKNTRSAPLGINVGMGWRMAA